MYSAFVAHHITDALACSPVTASAWAGAAPGSFDMVVVLR